MNATTMEDRPESSPVQSWQLDRPVLTLEQAADYLQISPRKLQNEMRNRRISFVRLGRRVLFRREALDAALKKMEIGMIAA